MKKVAVFPGSFDPITKGHEEIVKMLLEKANIDINFFMTFVVPGAENQLAVLGIEALFKLALRFAEVVVVTRNLIQNHLAVNQYQLIE